MNRIEMLVKRVFDVTMAFAGLGLFLVPLCVMAVFVKITSPGPVFFTQMRVGRQGQCFQCIKFRTMGLGGESEGNVTTATDSRITAVGRILRRWKLDELPQLWNVLTGHMSFVGPRPDVPGYADRLMGEERAVLELRPGITGPASLLFRDEETILANARDPQRFNDEVIYPAKVRINLTYALQWSFWRDLGYLFATVAPVLSRRVGIDRRLGLDISAFREHLIERSGQY
jgi:lipopolysaccharide/colanic/teichoic acid biosynthesis glycosyltransferase